MTPVQLVLFALASVMIGLSKGGLGGPLPVSLIVPVLSLVMPPQIAVPLMTPLLIFADVFALRIYWGKWDGAIIRSLAPFGFIGVIVGGLLLDTLDQSTIKIFIGLVTIVVIIYRFAASRIASLAYKPRNWHGWLAGFFSAISSTMATTGAPPFTIYMLLRKVEPVPFIGTATLFFAVINIVKIPVFLNRGLLDLSLLAQVWWAFLLIPLTVIVGRRSLDYINQIWFERVMLVLLFVSVLLLFGTL